MAQREELPPQYDPKTVEPKWYDQWEAGGYFRPQGTGEPYCIMIPPPNVTGSLHIGHALNNTLQDVLIRWKRMDGYKTLWQPGTDHAGIATQKVVSDQILQREKKTRWDLGREEFLKRVWDWKEESGGIIVTQLKRLGATPDWTRERFTMDEGLSLAVKQAFVTLFEKGLIERDLSLTNWCPGKCRTVLSDLEVEHEDVPALPPNPKRPIAEDFQKSGRLYHIKYPIAGSDQTITVATTRPETMLGDTAVAVNPKDERYTKLVGKKVALPLTDRQIPIIADDYVDMAFGSGVVKITPAHDPNDFEVGKRHDLPRVSIFDAEAKVNENGFAYKGLDRFEARKRVIKDLDAKGLLAKVEGHAMSIGTCQRCEAVVEPMISTQWFVRTKPLAKPAIEAVRAGRTRFIPEERTKIYLHWMENIRDWCISRQLWWGHQIPAWYCEACDGRALHKSDIGLTVDVSAKPIVSMTPPKECPRCKGTKLVQDPDVLDTWFSSGTWPFSTLGWPERTPELKTFYPTSALVTGFDIIFFWVARMMMFGLEFMGDVPFKDVYIHGLVRDEKGDKMSKTKGNVVDPLVLMDTYGTDALRFTLVALTQGNDMKLSLKSVEGNRNFANKIWNAMRFFLRRELPARIEAGPQPATLADRWILSRLQKTVEDVRKALEEYRYADVASALYQFTWDEFCDWYLEMIRPVLDKEEHAKIRPATQRTAVHVLDSLLRLLHPLMPFLTEEIWQSLPLEKPARSIMLAPYPKADPKLVDAAAEIEAKVLMDAIVAVRTIRSEMLITSKVDVVVATADSAARELLERERETFVEMAKVANVSFRAPGAPEKGAATAVVGPLEIFVPLKGHVDLAAVRALVQRDLAKLAKDREGVSGKLANEAYVSRAPKEIVEEQRANLKRIDDTLGKLQRTLKALEEIG